MLLHGLGELHKVLHRVDPFCFLVRNVSVDCARNRVVPSPRDVIPKRPAMDTDFLHVDDLHIKLA